MKRITTASERAQLKPGTICMDDAGNAWKRGTGSWVSTGGDTPALYDDMDLALTVLYSPGVKGDSPLGRIRELLKQLDHWESQGHKTAGTDYLRRHFRGIR